MPRNVRYSSNSGTKADIVLDPVCANQPPTPLDSHAPREPMRIITEVRRQIAVIMLMSRLNGDFAHESVRAPVKTRFAL
jgi:hypothetical protein